MENTINKIDDLDNPSGTQVNKDLYEGDKWMNSNPFNFIIGWSGMLLFVALEKCLDLFNRKDGKK